MGARVDKMWRGSLVILGIAASITPLAGQSPASPSKIADVLPARRLEGVVGPFGQHSATQVGAIWSEQTSMMHTIMLHHFHAALVDASGAPVEGAVAWELALVMRSAATGTVDTLVILSNNTPEFTLPRPLGYRVEQGDSVGVVTAVDRTKGGEREAYFVTFTADYDSADGAASRLSVIPMRTKPLTAAPDSSANGDVVVRQTWEWRADSSGRILAITGIPLNEANEISLHDVESNQILWRAPATQRRRGAFGASAHVIRLGVAVVAGHVYRLTTTVKTSEGAVTQGQPERVQAVMIPAAKGASLRARG